MVQEFVLELGSWITRLSLYAALVLLVYSILRSRQIEGRGLSSFSFQLTLVTLIHAIAIGQIVALSELLARPVVGGGTVHSAVHAVIMGIYAYFLVYRFLRIRKVITP